MIRLPPVSTQGRSSAASDVYKRQDQDRAYASSKGKPPGGDIFIHGGPRQKVYQKDWTAGCIAVTDKQIEIIYSMIKPGTPIHILP